MSDKKYVIVHLSSDTYEKRDEALAAIKALNTSRVPCYCVAQLLEDTGAEASARKKWVRTKQRIRKTLRRFSRER